MFEKKWCARNGHKNTVGLMTGSTKHRGSGLNPIKLTKCFSTFTIPSAFLTHVCNFTISKASRLLRKSSSPKVQFFSTLQFYRIDTSWWVETNQMIVIIATFRLFCRHDESRGPNTDKWGSVFRDILNEIERVYTDSFFNKIVTTKSITIWRKIYLKFSLTIVFTVNSRFWIPIL